MEVEVEGQTLLLVAVDTCCGYRTYGHVPVPVDVDGRASVGLEDDARALCPELYVGVYVGVFELEFDESVHLRAC